MNRCKVLALAAAVCCLATTPANAAYTYVGSWFVDAGPLWYDNAPVYSGQEAAAFLFGGSASDYAISTLGSDAGTINFSAYYDGWGDSETCGYDGPCAQDLHVDVNNDGYADPGGTDTAFSAYVMDHGLHLQNYAFRVDQTDAVPEPATWAMLIAGFGLVGGAMRRQKMAVAYG